MSFLNSILLGGLGAAAIPILIHLLYRRRVRVVVWGAMHLLEAALKKNRRRMRWEQLLLLLVRCLLVALLALALARPVLSQLPSLLGNTATASVLLLDNSLSMDARATGGSAFERAEEFALRKLNSLPRGSEAVLLPLASDAMPAPSTDPALVARQFESAVRVGGRADVVTGLSRAATVMERLRSPVREVTIISDFQRDNWSAPEADARARALAALQALDPAPRVTLVQVGEDVRNNVSAGPVELSRDTLGIGQPAQIRATVRNHGAQAWTSLRIHFRVDGTERGATQLTLNPGESRAVRFTHTFTEAGSHLIEISADADPLTADNTALHAVEVWDRVPVLLVNGDPGNSPLRGETDFLEIALSPFSAGKVASSDLIRARVIPVNQLNGGILAQSRACVLANVSKLSNAQVTMLKRFVAEGGGLLVFPGAKLDADWWNRVAHPAGLLPLPFRALKGSRHGGAAARVVSEPFSHPALALFNDQANGRLADAEFQTWFQFSPVAATNNAPSVLARLDSGDPFLVESRVGPGRVIAAATTCDPEWNNLPSRPTYVPLMQSLAIHLASALHPPRNLATGQPLLAYLPRGDAGKTAVLTLPSGRREELPVAAPGDRATVEFAGTTQTGVFRLQLPDGSRREYTVRTPPEESELDRLSKEELDALATAMNADSAATWETYEALDRDRRFGSELTRTLLFAVLGLILTELALQQWFGRRST